MEEDTIDFSEAFSSEAFTAIKDIVLKFLKMQGNAQNASLEFPDKTVYLHAHKDDVEIHIVSGDRPAPDLPEDEDDEDEDEA